MHGRWVLEKDFRFEAAHRLPNHDGKCARLHGHSWKGSVRVLGDRLETGGPKEGMLIDFSEIKRIVESLVEEKLDHHFLNESLPFIMPPTSERIAEWLYIAIDKLLVESKRDGRVSENVTLSSVTIEETCTSRCVYSETSEQPIKMLPGGTAVMR